MITTSQVADRVDANRNIQIIKRRTPSVNDRVSTIDKNWKEMITTSKIRPVLSPSCAQLKVEVDPVLSKLKKTDESIFFDGANGFGDSLFQRVVIKYLSQYFKTIYVHTPCPDLFWDIPNLKFVKEGHKWLRTQEKSAKLSRGKISPLPKGLKRTAYSYCPVRQLKKCSAYIIRTKLNIDVDDFDFTFPLRPIWISKATKLVNGFDMGNKKLCIIRPPTNRSEWDYPTRNPHPEYYQMLIDKYKDEYFYVSIADIEDNVEWLVGDLKGIDAKFHKGELSLSTIFGLMKISSMMICYPAFFMLAGIATRSKTFTIWGGCSHPAASLEESMGLWNFSYAAPDPACNCFLAEHDCNKEISKDILFGNFEELKNRKTNGRK